MKGTLVVRKLKKKGKYVSKIDFDPAFVDTENPNGFFKMVVCPIENKIWYCKVQNGYKILGEGYIVSGIDEKDIDEKIRNRRYYQSDKSIEHILIDESEL